MDKFLIPSAVAFEQLEEETVLLQTESSVYHRLDHVGSRFWALIDDGHTRSEIVETLLKEFDVEETILVSDLDRLVAELVDRGLLMEETGGAKD